MKNSQASPSEQGAAKSEGVARKQLSWDVTLQIWADGHHHDAFPLLSSLPQDGGQTNVPVKSKLKHPPPPPRHTPGI